MKGWIKRAFGAWLTAIRGATEDRITSADAVVFVDKPSFARCEGEGTDMSIEVKPDAVVSHVFPSGYPRMILTPSFSYRAEKTVEENTYHMILHEFGHTLGLGDTYARGLTVCKPGQPPSVMCGFHQQDKFLYMELQQDDIDGVRAIYRRVHASGATVRPGRVELARIFPLINSLNNANDAMERLGNEAARIIDDCATRGARLNPPVPRPSLALQETDDMRRAQTAYFRAMDVLHGFDQARADADPAAFRRAMDELKRLGDERDRLTSGEPARVRRAHEDFVQATNPEALVRYREIEDETERLRREVTRLEGEIEAFDQQSSPRVDGAPTPPPAQVQPDLPSPPPSRP